MRIIIEKYNLKSLSIAERISIVNEYIDYYNIQMNHLGAFYAFIIANENDLRKSEIDTYEWKKLITDMPIAERNVLERMKRDVEAQLNYEEELRRLKNQQQMTQQQYDEYYELLKILGTLLI